MRGLTVLLEPSLGARSTDQSQNQRVDDDGRPAVRKSEEAEDDVDDGQGLNDRVCLLRSDAS